VNSGVKKNADDTGLYRFIFISKDWTIESNPLFYTRPQSYNLMD